MRLKAELGMQSLPTQFDVEQPAYVSVGSLSAAPKKTIVWKRVSLVMKPNKPFQISRRLACTWRAVKFVLKKRLFKEITSAFRRVRVDELLMKLHWS